MSNEKHFDVIYLHKHYDYDNSVEIMCKDRECYRKLWEQKQALERRKVEGKKVSTSSASSPKNPYPLDEADTKALEGLQKMQPDRNWTAEKFYKQRYGK